MPNWITIEDSLKGRARAVERERERIVSFLVESSKCTLDGGHNQLGYCFCKAVELIKGENK